MTTTALTTYGAFSEQTFDANDARFVVSAHRPRVTVGGSRSNPKKRDAVWSVSQRECGIAYTDTLLVAGLTYAAAVAFVASMPEGGR
jgi:hypothetical protein